MNISQIDLRSLRYVVALAKHQNFRRAAEALFITQPALTKSIKNIESQLGIVLFDRLSTSVKPTPYCEIILEHAGKIFFEIEEINHKLETVAEIKSGHLNVGCGPHIAEKVLPDSVIEFINDYPQVSLQVVVENWITLVKLLRDGEMDVFIADIEGLSGHPDLTVTPLPTAEASFVCRRDHPLAAGGTVVPEDLLIYPMATPSMPERGLKWLRDSTPRGISADDYLAKSLRFFSDSQTLVARVVLETDYLTGGAESLFSEYLHSGAMVKLKPTGFAHLTEYRSGVVTLKSRTLPPAADIFIRYFTKSFEDFVR